MSPNHKLVIAFTLLLAVCSACAEWSEVNAELHEVALKDDTHNVERLLATGINPDTVEQEADAPLLWRVANEGYHGVAALLLQFAADVKGVDPGTGSTALQAATMKGFETIVRLLFAYGAEPDVADKKGSSPRKSIGPQEDMKVLYKIYDDHGAQGFEDPPGTWSLFEDPDKDNKPFYYNTITQEARWFKPPSCAWAKLSVEGQPVYMNAITKQSTWVKPPALCWQKMNVNGIGEFWINWKTNTTSKEVPAELPKDMVDHLEEHHSKYWFNEVTGEARWDDPAEDQWNELKDKDGRRYWFKPSTQDVTYKQPEETGWMQMESEEHKRPFFYNEVSQDITWEMPEPLGWSLHSEL
mmetsp:Transcript_35701/g.43057  ORF Transcript_35701/g.43057 Transcript_35701/m.43057 type:complete len:354 (+) Transcript_35701:96-1157(+)|eukprot:CAMPEP_0197854432 /NCGR_PEP_ID=MMETSP1438-20131217/24660_1 /TAXON_ID=1461541 /ORGANISM="Pterosperma sp., Strain CCMP1384" /LENGTH=353 /DNA_ID=CAMNT_0043469167 /DNA_START=94 /DNA_END=1155 /DNA_ORIENTATION=+